MNELALFAGAGGGILGGKIVGRRVVCAVEWSSFCARRLMQRQNEGHLSPFPIWDDVRTFDGRPWSGIVDVVSGGFPCQDISAAGKGAGIEGERSGMWAEMARIICEVQPSRVEVENSPMLTSRGLGRVLGDLAAMGFNAEWGVISAADTGASHLRERIWILAHSQRIRLKQMEQSVVEREKEQRPAGSAQYGNISRGWERWPDEPGVGRVADGVAGRVDRLRAIGNGQVPRVVATAWRILSEYE